MNMDKSSVDLGARDWDGPFVGKGWGRAHKNIPVGCRCAEKAKTTNDEMCSGENMPHQHHPRIQQQVELTSVIGAYKGRCKLVA